MGSALLVLHSYTTNVIVTQNVEYFQVGPTGIAKYDVNSLQLQAPRQNLGAFQRSFTLFRLDVGKHAAGNGGSILIGNIVD